MLYYAILAGVGGLIGFLLLRPRVKVLIAFFVMTSCFDLAPRLILNKDIWDLGAVLLLLAWVQLLLMKRRSAVTKASYITLLRVFIGWMAVCLVWSILIYGYQVLDTVKASRQMIIGFFSFFIFLRLFSVDPRAFDFFKKALYIGTYLLLPITIAQYAIGRQLLFGLTVEYDQVLRALPVFLPISLLYFWFIVSKLFTGERVITHEFMYAAMVIVVTALTFTRGIYFAALSAGGLMLATLAKENRLNTRHAVIWLSLSAITLSLLLLGGFGGRVISRLVSGLDIVTSGVSKSKQGGEDTFTGRLALTKERLEMVAEYNPLVGYGFIHEEKVPNALRAKLKHGSVIYSPEYVQKYQYGHPYVLALHSADIGWADIIVNTGIVGLILFVAILGAFATNYYTTTKSSDSSVYQLRLAFLLQIISLVLLMFNGNPFVVLVQIPSLMLAGYAYCNLAQQVIRPGNQLIPAGV